MKKKKINKAEKPEIPEKAFIFTKNSIWYIVAFVAIVIFTQALRSPVSSVIFYSYVIFVPMNLFFTYLSSKGIRVNLEASERTIEKNTPFSYQLTMSNESILPIPFSDAYLFIPDKESVRTNIKKVLVSLPPMAITSVMNTVSFPFRGTYTVGVETMYIYDFFKTVKIRVDISEKKELFVVPRRLKSSMDRSIVTSDATNAQSRSPFSPEKTEVDDVREYRLGDQLKSIHWKLSSKSENFIVRDYTQGTVNANLVFVDLAMRDYEKICQSAEPDAEDNPFELRREDYLYDMNDYCVDGAVECAVSVVSKLLLDGEKCVLAWHDARSSSGIYAFMLETEDDFDKIFKLFAGAPIAPAEKTLKSLRDIFNSWSDVRKIYVTSALDHDAALAYTLIGESDSSTAFGNSDMIYFSSVGRMKNPALWRSYVDDCGMQLRKKGITLREFTSIDLRTKEVVS